MDGADIVGDIEAQSEFLLEGNDSGFRSSKLVSTMKRQMEAEERIARAN